MKGLCVCGPFLSSSTPWHLDCSDI